MTSESHVTTAAQAGIVAAEQLLARNLSGPTYARLVAGQRGVIAQHATLIGPQGQALAPASPRVAAADVAYAEAFIETIESRIMVEP